jgi:DNA polymerase III alpha subunit (gram-positive type)
VSGKVVAQNIMVMNVEDPKLRQDNFHIEVGLGQSVKMGVTEAREYLREYVEQADGIVIHGAPNDVPKLDLFGIEMNKKPIFDTFEWAKEIFPEGPHRLNHLTGMLGGSMLAAHVAGHDAEMALVSLLRMAECYG